MSLAGRFRRPSGQHRMPHRPHKGSRSAINRAITERHQSQETNLALNLKPVCRISIESPPNGVCWIRWGFISSSRSTRWRHFPRKVHRWSTKQNTHTHTHTLEKNVNKNKQTAHWRFLPFYGQGCRPLCPNKVKRVNKAKQNESTETPLVSGRFFFCVDTSTAFYFSLIVLCVCVCVLFPRTESLSLGVDDCKIVLGITAEATRSIRP